MEIINYCQDKDDCINILCNKSTTITNDDSNENRILLSLNNNNNQTSKWTKLTLPNVVNNDEEYDSEVINTLYDNLLQESLKIYSDSKKNILKTQKPKIIIFNKEMPFDCINDNIITYILNYLDLYSVIYFTQTCKKVAKANHSPYLLSSYFLSLSNTQSDHSNQKSIDFVNNVDNDNDNVNVQITQDTHNQKKIPNNMDDIKINDFDNNIKKNQNPFSFLEPIDLTKVRFVNPKTNDVIHPFAHLEINEEPELPEFDTEYVNNFINVDVNKIDQDITTSLNNNNNNNDAMVIPTNTIPYLDLNNSINESKYLNNNNKGLTMNVFTINIQYQLNRNN